MKQRLFKLFTALSVLLNAVLFSAVLAQRKVIVEMDKDVEAAIESLKAGTKKIEECNQVYRYLLDLGEIYEPADEEEDLP